MKRQIEIILLLLLVLGSIGINTVVVLILTIKTIISTILIDEIATLAIASFALAVEIIALPYILNLIRDSKYYSRAYTMRSWVNPKHLCTKIFSFSVFIIVILITAIFTHKPNNEVYRVTPLQYEQVQNLSHFKDYFISSQRILNNFNNYKDWERQEYLKDKTTIEQILWGDTIPEDIDCLY